MLSVNRLFLKPCRISVIVFKKNSDSDNLRFPLVRMCFNVVKESKLAGKGERIKSSCEGIGGPRNVV